MLAYRVYPHLQGALPGTAGHPQYLGTQGSGRLDNHGHYRIWYLALEPAGAIAEIFGDLDQWDANMFHCPSIPGSRQTLAIDLDDDTVDLVGELFPFLFPFPAEGQHLFEGFTQPPLGVDFESVGGEPFERLPLAGKGCRSIHQEEIG